MSNDIPTESWSSMEMENLKINEEEELMEVEIV